MGNDNTLNSTPNAQRTQIAFFGMRNAGKSSVVNAILGQPLSIVSDHKGTTTDPVQKAMELLPLGPVLIIDTPGLDDEGELGQLRVEKAKQILNKTDIAVLVIDTANGASSFDLEIIDLFKEKNIPYLVVYNKLDLYAVSPKELLSPSVFVSAKTMEGVCELKNKLATLIPIQDEQKRIVEDLIQPHDFVLLVVPIDKAAPKGRLILPQQQTIRDILDSSAISIVAKEDEISNVLGALGKKPSLVITDSQVFEKVAKETPEDIPMTSFSILFARYKGNLISQIQGAKALDNVQDHDTILISEGCSHHRQCGDIGTEKLPHWILTYTKKDIQFEFTQGTDFPSDLSKYKLIIHCGGCMLNERQMQYRLACAKEQRIPMTNYGVMIAYMKGILERSIHVFPELQDILR